MFNKRYIHKYIMFIRGVFMRKIFILFVLVGLFNFCAEKSEKPELIFEEGVEVVLNRLEPYTIRGEPSSLLLEEEFTIDFEREDLAEQGMGDILGFEVDSKGNIYCICESRIFQFDSRGQYIRKFGENGQGPGEIQYPMRWWTTKADELGLFDYLNDKFLFFDEAGRFINEIKIPSNIRSYGPVWTLLLEGGSSLFQETSFNREAETHEHHLTVLDSSFERMAQLQESVIYENPFRSARFNLMRTHILSQAKHDKIYAACQQNEDFLINIYNLQGQLLKQIHKEYKKVDIPKSYRDQKMEEYLNSTPYRVHKMLGYFPAHFPPMKNLYVDDRGRMFVETYEEGEEPGSEMVDIFNAEGINTGRVALKIVESRVFKNERLYDFLEKESGFQKLVVYRISWSNS